MNERIQALIDEADEVEILPDEEFCDTDFLADMDPRRVKILAELLIRECGELVKARLNHIPDDQEDWVGHNYGETAAVYGLLDTFQEHFGVDCDPKNSKFGVAK